MHSTLLRSLSRSDYLITITQHDKLALMRRPAPTIPLSRDALTVLHKRYEVLSILNDLMIGIWFITGSILFLFPSLTQSGAWVFVFGSLQFMLRPTIRLARHLHLQAVGNPQRLASSNDF